MTRAKAIDWKGRLVSPTGLPGYFAFVPPPAGFEPLAAAHDVLARYGYPMPPDANASPAAHLFWKRSVTTVRRSVVPDLGVMPKVGRRPRGVHASGRPDDFAVPRAGAIVTGHVGLPVHGVFGEWKVPSVPSASGAFAVVGVQTEAVGLLVQVGIDGTIGDVPSLARAGTGQWFALGDEFGRLVPIGPTNARFEWVPDDPVEILNFPVSAGDALVVRLQHHPELGAVSASYSNLTTGTVTSFLRVAPLAGAFEGSAAGWTVEGSTLPTGEAILPEFDVVTFTGVGAHAGARGALVDATDAEPIRMLDPRSRALLATAEVAASGSEVRCRFVGAEAVLY
jgi:Peptidase A4 family